MLTSFGLPVGDERESIRTLFWGELGFGWPGPSMGALANHCISRHFGHVLATGIIVHEYSEFAFVTIELAVHSCVRCTLIPIRLGAVMMMARQEHSLPLIDVRG
jgi:hypothetical protein